MMMNCIGYTVFTGETLKVIYRVKLLRFVSLARDCAMGAVTNQQQHYILLGEL